MFKEKKLVIIFHKNVFSILLSQKQSEMHETLYVISCVDNAQALCVQFQISVTIKEISKVRTLRDRVQLGAFPLRLQSKSTADMEGWKFRCKNVENVFKPTFNFDLNFQKFNEYFPSFQVYQIKKKRGAIGNG